MKILIFATQINNLVEQTRWSHNFYSYNHQLNIISLLVNY